MASLNRFANASIVPDGFQSTAHSIFLNYVPPLRPNILKDVTEKFPSASSIDSCPENTELKCRQETSTEVLTCPICISKLSSTALATLVRCKHNFCFDCITAWLDISQTCPICKKVSDYLVRSTDDCNLHDEVPTRGFKIYTISLPLAVYIEDDIQFAK